MTFLSKRYHCQQRPSDSIHVIQNAANTNVYFTTYDGGDVAEVDLSRKDALSLAWDIIEHFEEGTRPTPPIKAGDYVRGILGIIGRVMSVDDYRGTLIAKAPNGTYEWVISNCTPVTEQEFIDYYQQRVTDIVSKEQ